MEPTFRSWYERKMYANPQIADETRMVDGLLRRLQTVAIVGISKDEHKDSHYVGRYLKNAGYRIVPVNPGSKIILGENCYPTLRSIPFPVDAVDIFRKPADILDVVEEAIDIGAWLIWLQLGTGTHPEAMKRAAAAGRLLIQNRCMKVDHQFLIRENHNQPQPIHHGVQP
ncbi:MAG TPA: CoA-binding protein [Bacteroidota bacterium]|nr:CoA-binding protein [Bacteroidota bacterium]